MGRGGWSFTQKSENSILMYFQANFLKNDEFLEKEVPKAFLPISPQKFYWLH